jgi:hypothetical protein
VAEQGCIVQWVGDVTSPTHMGVSVVALVLSIVMGSGMHWHCHSTPRADAHGAGAGAESYVVCRHGERDLVYTCLRPKGPYLVWTLLHKHTFLDTQLHLANPHLVELWCFVTRKDPSKGLNLYTFLSFQQDKLGRQNSTLYSIPTKRPIYDIFEKHTKNGSGSDT